MVEQERYGYAAHTKCIFGCGYEAEAVKQRMGRDDKGVQIRTLKLRPTPTLNEFYNLQQQVDNDGTITMIYPEHLIRQLNHDDSNRVILIMCTFNHQRTILMEDQPLIDEIARLRKLNADLLRQGARLQGQNRRLRSQSEEVVMDWARLIGKIQRHRPALAADDNNSDSNLSSAVIPQAEITDY